MILPPTADRPSNEKPGGLHVQAGPRSTRARVRTKHTVLTSPPGPRSVDGLRGQQGLVPPP